MPESQTMPETHIPVYLSSHQPGIEQQEGYGAFIRWEIGQRVIFGKHRVGGTIASDTMAHASAPLIDGARGKGRWIREIICDDDGQRAAVSEANIFTDQSDPRWQRR